MSRGGVQRPFWLWGTKPGWVLRRSRSLCPKAILAVGHKARLGFEEEQVPGDPGAGKGPHPTSCRWQWLPTGRGSPRNRISEEQPEHSSKSQNPDGNDRIPSAGRGVPPLQRTNHPRKPRPLTGDSREVNPPQTRAGHGIEPWRFAQEWSIRQSLKIRLGGAVLSRYTSLLFPSFLCDISGVAATLCKELTARGRVGMQGRGGEACAALGAEDFSKRDGDGSSPRTAQPRPWHHHGTLSFLCPHCARLQNEPGS